MAGSSKNTRSPWNCRYGSEYDSLAVGGERAIERGTGGKQAEASSLGWPAVTQASYRIFQEYPSDLLMAQECFDREDTQTLR